MLIQDKKYTEDFEALRISLASPEDILNWSHGEVVKAETINYRTFKPEKDGLFCEKIFGPQRDYECYCGKYKGLRYKGVICDKCGVEVTRSLVRRERMGHITLAAPVVHTWFIRRIPYKIPLLLSMRPTDLEAVIYFAAYVVLSVDEEKRAQTLNELQKTYEQRLNKLLKKFEEKVKALNTEYDKKEAEITKRLEQEQKEGRPREGLEMRLDALKRRFREQEIALKNRKESYEMLLKEKKQRLYKKIEELEVKSVLSEESLEELSRWGGRDFMEIDMGAEAIARLLKEFDLDGEIELLTKQVKAGKGGGTLVRSIKRLKLLRGFKNSKVEPAWMILTVLPVIPPDLRPMVQLSGGRFATSDLNDLYRRVINRNTRLRELLQQFFYSFTVYNNCCFSM